MAWILEHAMWESPGLKPLNILFSKETHHELCLPCNRLLSLGSNYMEHYKNQSDALKPLH